MSVPIAHFSDSSPASPQFVAVIILCAFVLVVLVAFHRPGRRRAAGMDEARRKVHELYRGTVIPAEEPRFAFDGRTATVVDDEEMPGSYSEGEYSLTRYARNPDGEYFMLMFEVNGGKPRLVFAKLVEHHIARFVLKDKYTPPPSE